MKQSPSRVFHKKMHKPSYAFSYLLEQKNFYPKRGEFALKSLQSGKLTFKQIEAGRKSIRRAVSKLGKVTIRTFTYASLTKRSVGVRMGKGKGGHHVWVSPIKKGQIIYEITGVNSYKSFFALKKASDKMPFMCSVVNLIY